MRSCDACMRSSSASRSCSTVIRVARVGEVSTSAAAPGTTPHETQRSPAAATEGVLKACPLCTRFTMDRYVGSRRSSFAAASSFAFASSAAIARSDTLSVVSASFASSCSTAVESIERSALYVSARASALPVRAVRMSSRCIMPSDTRSTCSANLAVSVFTICAAYCSMSSTARCEPILARRSRCRFCTCDAKSWASSFCDACTPSLNCSTASSRAWRNSGAASSARPALLSGICASTFVRRSASARCRCSATRSRSSRFSSKGRKSSAVSSGGSTLRAAPTPGCSALTTRHPL
mmetsp:Transcript_30724/g.94932  ORF Transcript_30724/g.94932 Transcript_30724/m.94932 type:complete len:294 (-) Transcript_30724:12-893(-)